MLEGHEFEKWFKSINKMGSTAPTITAGTYNTSEVESRMVHMKRNKNSLGVFSFVSNKVVKTKMETYLDVCT